METLPILPTRATQGDYLELLDVERALRALPVEQREVLLLIAVEEMTYDEVSKALDVPIGTVMSRLSRGRERLRQVASATSNQTLKVVK